MYSGSMSLKRKTNISMENFTIIVTAMFIFLPHPVHQHHYHWIPSPFCLWRRRSWLHASPSGVHTTRALRRCWEGRVPIMAEFFCMRRCFTNMQCGNIKFDIKNKLNKIIINLTSKYSWETKNSQGLNGI